MSSKLLLYAAASKAITERLRSSLSLAFTKESSTYQKLLLWVSESPSLAGAALPC